MFPRERRGMGEKLGRDGVALTSQMADGIGQIGRIPVDDGGDEPGSAPKRGTAARPGRVSNPALLERADHLGEGVALLALVEASMAKLAQLRRFQPVQHVYRVRLLRPSS